MNQAFVAAALAVFTGQLVKGVTGFGAALVSVPVLVWVWGPRDAVVVISVVELASGVLLVASVLKQVRWTLVFAVSLPLLCGQWVGTELLLYLSERWVALGLGVLVALFGLDVVFRPAREGRGDLESLPDGRTDILIAGAAAGLTGGVMAGLVGAPGPPVALFMRWYFENRFFRAQLLAVFTLAALSLLAMTVFKGVATSDVLERALFLLVPMAIGAVTGAWLSERVPKLWFGRAVGAVLVLSGLALALSSTGAP